MKLIEYIKTDVYEDYLIPNMKNKMYAMVRYQDVIEVLEKIKFDIGIFSKAADKSKRKTIETVIKSLKGI